MNTLVAEKVEQAVGLLHKHNMDCWIIFTQEMGRECDSVYPLLMDDLDLGGGILAIFRNGRRVAITSGLDRALPLSTGVWNEVIVYTREMPLWEALKNILRQEDPQTIAINYSETNSIADGLSHGKYLALTKALAGTPYLDRLISSEPVACALRGVKTPQEIARIEEAIGLTDIVFERLRGHLRPNMPALEVFDFIQQQILSLGASCAWSPYNCPVITMGPVEYMGHTPPSAEMCFRKGYLMQVDLGLRYHGYCSDFQRMFYMLQDGEECPPAPVQELFRHVHDGITKMIEAIRPGVPNTLPSRIGFAELTDYGYPEPLYSAGHQLGRAVHDGGNGLLNYHTAGNDSVMQIGNVFTVEGLETRLEGYGFVSLEEDVVVTDTGARILTKRQNEIMCIR